MRLLAFILCSCLFATLSASRLKDLTTIEGSRENQLVGYGLVVGLAGDGDSSLEYTVQSVSNFLARFGIRVDPNDVDAKNVAAVMVTADIGPYAREGSRLNVTVSSIGDAESLQGGVLLQTPLIAADEQVYAVAQGPIAVGGFLGGEGGPGGATVQRNHPTVAMISGGAIVERSVPTEIVRDGSLNLMLLNPDFTSAARIAEAVNEVFPASALATDSGTVNVEIPELYYGQEVGFIGALGLIEVMPDSVARVVINERTGTIVATSTVRISTVAVSHGSLTITISGDLEVSQPNPLNDSGDTVVTEELQTTVKEVRGGFTMIEEYPSLERVTAALNALGVTTREMMAILQAMKRAGALQAELILE